MKANIYVLLIVFIIGFIAALFQTEAWAIYVLIPCGLYVAYSFFYMIILVIKSYKKKMIFNIKKGKHSTWSLPVFTLKKNISGTFKFIEGFKYQIKKQKDSNKLIGLSDGLHHHYNSVRIGWRYNILHPDMIEMVGIIYNNGKRSIFGITYVDPTKENSFSIEIIKGYYKIQINKTVVSAIRTSKWNFFRYRLNPYFGGDSPSPNNFSVNISLIFK